MGSKTLKEAMQKALSRKANAIEKDESLEEMSEADYLVHVCIAKLKTSPMIRPSQLKDLQVVAGEDSSEKERRSSIDDLLKGVSNDKGNRT